ncbi:transposase [Flavobacterium sp. FlaQc-47]|uniref:transposase n=1 Tax=Flavobacterium sp. FlaQc-47 TaxID=3374180 RepID=UPI003757C09B
MNFDSINIYQRDKRIEVIRSKRQLTTYAGLDVKEKLSGSSVKGKPSIFKRGNR